jgi:predicted porin
LFAGFTIDWEVVPNKVATSLGYTYTNSINDMDQEHENNVVDELPDAEHKVHRVELSGEYFLDKKTTLLARVVYEDYESFNWAYSTDYPAGTGWEDPNHTAGLIEMGVRYQF